jgi:hypothetical protein
VIVSSFSDTRGDNVAKMDVALEDDGVAALYIDAYVQVSCAEHGKEYTNHIEGEVGCTWKVSKQDLDDLEMAIRGWPESGNRLMWRTIRQVIEMKGDQCHQA